MVVETEIRKMREAMQQEFAMMRKLIVQRIITDNWIMQDVACSLLNVQPRQLQRIRKHIDKNGNAVGCIGWRKGKGKTVQYDKRDIEKYLNQITIA